MQRFVCFTEIDVEPPQSGIRPCDSGSKRFSVQNEARRGLLEMSRLVRKCNVLLFYLVNVSAKLENLEISKCLVFFQPTWTEKHANNRDAVGNALAKLINIKLRIPVFLKNS